MVHTHICRDCVKENRVDEVKERGTKSLDRESMVFGEHTMGGHGKYRYIINVWFTPTHAVLVVSKTVSRRTGRMKSRREVQSH